MRSDHHGPSFPLKEITEQQKEGIRMVKRVMMALEGEDGLDEIYSFSESLRQLCVFKKIEKSSMAWSCQLTIGSNLSIRIVAYKSVSGRYTFFKEMLPGRLICLHKELTTHVWAI